MSEAQHETVGHYFRAFGDIYLCFRYERRAGFWMRCIQKGKEAALIDRAVGQEACVSERAIGRTYHHAWNAPWDDNYQAHEQPCECYVCRKEKGIYE